MRGLIYRSPGCLVSPTSTVNTVILNLHAAKGSKLWNNYARRCTPLRLERVGCTLDQRRGEENILHGFERTTSTRFPSREIILRFVKKKKKKKKEEEM